MSCFSGPNVIEDGLVMSLDAANPKSYNPNLVTTFGKFNYSFNGQIISTQLDVAPDGSLVLCKHDLTGASSPFMNVRVFNSIPIGTYTISAWVKGTTAFSASFSYIGETPGTSGAAATTINVTTAWQRFTHTFSVTAAQTNGRVQIFFGTEGNNKIISVYGVQMVQGSMALDYYPYTGISVNTWVDLSKDNNNGTLENNITFNTENLGSLVFDRSTSNQYVSFLSSSSLLFLNRLPYTLETWVYPTVNPGASTFTGIFNREDSSTGSRDGYNIYLNGSSTTTMSFVGERFQAGTNRSVTFTTTEATILNKWNHVCVTYDGTNLILYHNSTNINSRSDATGNISNTSKTLEIGRRGTGSYYGGRLTGMRIYNRALSDSEILQNFNSARTRFGL